MKLKIHRTDGWIEVLLLPHKNGSGYSYINMTKGHICPCKFPTIEEALKDLQKYSNIISWEEI